MRDIEGVAFHRNSRVIINGKEYSRGFGGGININGSIVIFEDVEIIKNRTAGKGKDDNDGGIGAGAYIAGGAEVTFRRCKINNNRSSHNIGGLWIDRSVVHMYNCEVRENYAVGTGSGIQVYTDGTIYMYNTVVADNEGHSYGAAVYIRQNSNAYLVNCLITGNTSTSDHGGGGLMMYDNCNSTLISSTITKNDISGPGGGVYRQKGNNSLTVYNSIISGNIQINNGPDIDVFEINAKKPLIMSSITGVKVYDVSGSRVIGVSFDASTMLDAYFVPQGSNNPALEKGMGMQSLSELASSFTPPLEGSFVEKDIEGYSRLGLNVMGAKVK